MQPAEIRLRADCIVRELSAYPVAIFNLEEILFLTHRCKRIPGSQEFAVLAFDEFDLRELEKIAQRVKKETRKNFRLLNMSKRRR